jgi:hypothetical protein
MIMAFRFGSTGVNVVLPEELRDLIGFLTTYFTPYFQVESVDNHKLAAGVPTVSVRVEHPPGSVVTLCDRGPLIEVDNSHGFLRMTGSVHVDSTSKRRHVLLRPFGVLLIETGPNQYELIGSDQERLKIPLLRMIEDISVSLIEAAGGVFVHACGVVCADRAILAIGHKRAGKTTILCRALSEFRVSKLANDNCVLCLSEKTLSAQGWPGFFKVDIATVVHHRQLAAYFPSDMTGALESAAALWDSRVKVPLFPREAVELFHTDIRPAAPVGAILFPSFSEEHAPALLRISTQKAADQVGEFLQGSENANHPNWLGRNAQSRAELAARLSGYIREAGTSLGCYEISWCKSIDDLLTDVPDLRQHREALQMARAGGHVRPPHYQLPLQFDAK